MIISMKSALNHVTLTLFFLVYEHYSMQQLKTMTIPSVSNNGQGLSMFTTRQVDLSGDNARMLSEQITAVNFRFRESDESYSSTWHVAGDATLLIILSGTLRVALRSGEAQEFTAGEMFVAEDYLLAGVAFDNSVHGHRAEVVGDQSLSAIHLKLEKRTVAA